MSGAISATPRTYNGVTFRSTLEADWAATLDGLKVEWLYEPQTIALPSGARYRPDFYLPAITTWFEVKGGHNERIEKVREFAETTRHAPDCDRTPGRHVSRWITSAEGEERAGRNAAEARERLRRAPAGETEATLRTCGVTTPSLRRRVAWPLLHNGFTDHDWYPAAADTQMFPGDGDGRSSCVTLDCSCGGGDDYGVPYRRVVVGRANAFESADGQCALSLTGCAECKVWSFVPDGGFRRCRACGAGGHAWGENSRVYRSGRDGPWSLAMARVERPEKSAGAQARPIATRTRRTPVRVPSAPPTRLRRVYLAGKISASDWRWPIVGHVLPRGGVPGDFMPAGWPDWEIEKGAVLDGMGDYVGPYYLECHGDAPLYDDHGLTGCCEESPPDEVRAFARTQCTQAIDLADIVFAWLADLTAHGTVFELGYASARGKRIVIAHPPVPAILEHLWFTLGAAHKGDVIVTDDPAAALREVLEPWQPRAEA